MWIENNILKYYLRNAYFITGTAYAGKSTAARMLAERYGLIHLEENYFTKVTNEVADPQKQPDLCYIPNLTDWRDFVNRSPEEYARWSRNVPREVAGFEVAEIISRTRDQKAIVDTNIPLEILRQISDEAHVAVMLSPKSMSVERFFDRSDPEKQFLLRVIEGCPDPEATMKNFRAGLSLINSREVYDEYLSSGFFTLIRPDSAEDTREEVCKTLARHFGFLAP